MKNKKEDKDEKEEVIRVGDDDKWEYFDDCPICQAMKEGRADTYEGLMKAFEEAKRMEKKSQMKGRKAVSNGGNLKVAEKGKNWSINTNEWFHPSTLTGHLKS